MANKKIEYTLDIHKALDIILAGGAVRGENFRHGYYLKLNSFGQLVLVDAKDLYREDEWISYKSLAAQKFRELSVMTLKELSF